MRQILRTKKNRKLKAYKPQFFRERFLLVLSSAGFIVLSLFFINSGNTEAVFIEKFYSNPKILIQIEME